MALLDDAAAKPKLPNGAYSKIARRLRPKVTPQAVRLVYLGVSVSARIRAAIDTYRRGLPTDHPAHLSPRAPIGEDDPEAHASTLDRQRKTA